MENTFWRGKKVLITGHTGFKGSWLSLILQELGAELTGFALAPSDGPNLFTEAKVSEKMLNITGDIRDFSLVKNILHQYQPEIVFHLAAQSLVHESYRTPVETYSTNVMGTVNLLEAVRYCDSVKVLINVTSDKCYDNKEWEWGYRENEPLGGYDPYSSSKACAELVTSAYRCSFFGSKKIASVRAGNVIGGGDFAKDRLVPDMMRAFFENHPVKIRNPEAIRPWQHVLEPLSGYLLLAEKLWEKPDIFAQAFNFGPYEEEVQSVRFIADRVTKLWENPPGWVQDDKYFPHEAHLLKLDSSKARTLLGWKPRLSLEKTLEYVVAWYKAFQNRKNMHKITLDQIEAYRNT